MHDARTDGGTQALSYSDHRQRGDWLTYLLTDWLADYSNDAQFKFVCYAMNSLADVQRDKFYPLSVDQLTAAGWTHAILSHFYSYENKLTVYWQFPVTCQELRMLYTKVQSNIK